MTDPNAWQLPTYYTADKQPELRYKFKNSKSITRNNFPSAIRTCLFCV